MDDLVRLARAFSDAVVAWCREARGVIDDEQEALLVDGSKQVVAVCKKFKKVIAKVPHALEDAPALPEAPDDLDEADLMEISDLLVEALNVFDEIWIEVDGEYTENISLPSAVAEMIETLSETLSGDLDDLEVDIVEQAASSLEDIEV